MSHGFSTAARSRFFGNRLLHTERPGGILPSSGDDRSPTTLGALAGSLLTGGHACRALPAAHRDSQLDIGDHTH